MASKLIVISAPSGCGKTTIAHKILGRHPDFEFSVSATTRPRREHEVEGRDYYFWTREQFLRAVDEGRFIEWEEIYKDMYGSLKSEVERVFNAGRSIVFDIDVKGALSIKKQFPDAILIFIKPPSMDVLRTRLENRKTDNPDSLRRRIERMPMELAMEKEFDFGVVNDNLEKAVDEVDAIIAARPGTPQTAARV